MPPEEFITLLPRDLDVTICNIPFVSVIEAALTETWTRDPFDRMIVAQARAGGGKLISPNRKILEHFDQAVW